jgi:hypothetical protein
MTRCWNPIPRFPIRSIPCGRPYGRGTGDDRRPPGVMSKATLEQALPRVAERPFEADRKRMTTVHRLPSRTRCLAGGLTLGDG